MLHPLVLRLPSHLRHRVVGSGFDGDGCNRRDPAQAARARVFLEVEVALRAYACAHAPLHVIVHRERAGSRTRGICHAVMC